MADSTPPICESPDPELLLLDDGEPGGPEEGGAGIPAPPAGGAGVPGLPPGAPGGEDEGEPDEGEPDDDGGVGSGDDWPDCDEAQPPSNTTHNTTHDATPVAVNNR